MKENIYTVEIPDDAYWKKQIKCQNACPVHTDSRGYVRAIAEGDLEKAYLIARAPNPLASICGRICGAPCEIECRRGSVDRSVSIRALKRFVTEKFGVESGRYASNPMELIHTFTSGADECSDVESIRAFLSHFTGGNAGPGADAPTVGIIGAGPAGLACAHDLCLMGIKPVIYEMEPVPAGMLYLGVPEYRLPRDLIVAEVEVIKAMGTEIKCNTAVGKDIEMKELREKHDAVVIAVGLKKSRSIPVANIDAPGVLGGIDILRDVALRFEVKLGEKVIVIGGGNVAYDVARTLVRQTQTELDISRTVMRQKGVKEVVLTCLESLEEMPADEVEIREGDEEGVIRYNSLGPREILVDGTGKVRGVKFVRCLSVFDENGRFSPKFNENEIIEIMADNVVLAVGQTSDLSFIKSDDIKLNERGQLVTDPTKTMTGAPDVFTAGDISLGPGLMIDAIASGKKAAMNIYQYITKKKIQSSLTSSHIEIKDYAREWSYENIEREGVPSLSPAERRFSMDLSVEKGYSHNQGIAQSRRCYNCSINTIFNGEKCILCGGCADVCPESCLKLVSAEKLKGNGELEALIKNRYGDMPITSGGAIIKDEARCIRCGLCAERCPVSAVTMESYNFKESFYE